MIAANAESLAEELADVSRRLGTAERALKQAQEAERRARTLAEEAIRLKEEFLATLSHELRTPLAAVIGWGRMLQSGGVLPEQRDHAIDVMVRNATAQSHLIDDLLDVAAPFRLNVEPVDVARIVAAAVSGARQAATVKSIEIVQRIGPDAGIVAGDARRLQQAVWNILSNAVKFTPRNGRIVVELRRVGAQVELTVSDSGCGIAQDFIPHVFERFRQEDPSPTRKTGGLGLGLAIVKSIVELHGGAVEARSDGPGRGCSIAMHIPLAALHPVAPADGASVKPACFDLAGRKVLVIDDEPDAREVLRAILESCQATVATAGSAAEGLELVEGFKPDVIVSDIGMPETDGYAFIRALRKRSPSHGGRTPAIALTAYARDTDRDRAVAEGFQRHAAKPIEPDALLRQIASVLDRAS